MKTTLQAEDDGDPTFGSNIHLRDNMSVIHNDQRPELTLSKISNSICHHTMRESVAMGESLTTYLNPAQ